MTQCTKRPQRASPDPSGIDRVAAVAVAVAFNLACVWLLFRVPVDAPVAPGSAPLVVVWIEPPAPAPAAPRAKLPEARPTARPIAALTDARQRDELQRTTKPTAQDAPRPARAGASPPLAVAEVEPDPALLLAAPPVPEASTRSSVQPSRSFAPDPFGPRLAPAGVAQDRMQLRFSDRSLGGRWKDMSVAAICGELRHSLHGSPKSVLSIEASMRRHGCGAY